MQECRFSLPRILPYKETIVDSLLIRENALNETSYSRIFYVVKTIALLIICLLLSE